MLLRTDPAQAAAIANNPALLDRTHRASGRTLRSRPLVCTFRSNRRSSQGAIQFVVRDVPALAGYDPGHPSTLREAEQRLPAIRAMGFDVLYLPPIHPIGLTNRKGPGQLTHSPTLQVRAARGPSGIRLAAIRRSNPRSASLRDFDHFVAAAHEHGLEVALDFAIQCSPDHPWVKEHPAWFNHRPDGSIKYAENPPKEYQDIYPVNFGTADRDASTPN